MPLQLALILLASPEQLPTQLSATTCQIPHLGIELGAGFNSKSKSGLSVSGAASLTAGWQLDPCLGWPVRLEAGLASTTAGPPWGRGVKAVEVSTWHVDIAVAAGPSMALNPGEPTALGLELLAGPNLRLTRVSTRIRRQSSSNLEPRALMRLLGGGFVETGALRLTLRAFWSLPRGDGIGALAGLAYRL